MKRSPHKRWEEPVLGNCACSQLRRVARAISVFYDGFLKDSGMTVTQYALLVTIGRAGKISRTKLAGKMGMERTTLIRNLRPLEQREWVEGASSEDRRERLLRLTPLGLKFLSQSYPLWEKAQKSFLRKFGQEKFAALTTLLGESEQAIQSAI